jgi:uncharacterized membrane protein
MADLFPKGTFDEIKSPLLLAVILIVAASFLIGLAMRSEAGRRIGRWIDRTTLGRLPGYSVLKSLTNSFKEKEEGAAFSPALLISPDGVQEIVYVIEDHGDGQLTVLVPWAPAAFSGFVKIVDRDRVEMLDANLADVTMVLSHWGAGVHDLLGKARTGADPKSNATNKRRI